MEKRKYKLTLTDCINIYELPEVMAQAGMEIDWLTGIDIAHNKNIVSEIVKGYRISAKAPARIVKYNDEVAKITRTLNGNARNEKLKALNKQYESDIEKENARLRKLEAERDKKTFDLELIPIKAEAIKGESKFATIIADSLMPILER